MAEESEPSFAELPDSSWIGLDGRRALVTGAARGIGRATAVTLARFGADVAICDRLEDELGATAEAIKTLGCDAPVAVLDVRDRTAVDRWIGDLESMWDSLDILVNNAGGGFVSAVADLSPNAQAALIAENFTQVVDVTRRCLPLLRRGAVHREASIVNVTSIEAHRAGPGFGIYSAMKAAVDNLTRTLALELATDRIRVNAVAPDMIPTPGDAGLVDDSGAMSEIAWDPTPWPGTGSSADVAAAIVWLAGPMSRFVTGTTVHVDGGTYAASGWKRSTAGGAWVL